MTGAQRVWVGHSHLDVDAGEDDPCGRRVFAPRLKGATLRVWQMGTPNEPTPLRVLGRSEMCAFDGKLVLPKIGPGSNGALLALQGL